MDHVTNIATLWMARMAIMPSVIVKTAFACEKFNFNHITLLSPSKMCVKNVISEHTRSPRESVATAQCRGERL